jgi:hypothetical protein
VLTAKVSLVKTKALTDEKKERIRFNLEVIKILMVVFLGSAGGVITLILEGLSSGKYVIFTAGGMILAVVTGSYVISLY